MNNKEVLFQEMPAKKGAIGIITLNRPRSLNALNLDMIHAIQRQLDSWRNRQDLVAVIIRSAKDRVFCSGGDIRAVYNLYQDESQHERAKQFFKYEYYLNRTIYHYPKPYIALIDGLAMGGGLGVSVNGSHRIVTENTLMAMPECAIGFFPDIGSSYFLTRAPGALGTYLALTSLRLDAANCLYAKLGTHYVPSCEIKNLLHCFAAQALDCETAYHTLNECIEQFSATSTPRAGLAQEQGIIDKHFNHQSLEEIMSSLQAGPGNGLRELALHAVQHNSPTSMKVALALLQKAKHLSFDECSELDYCLSQRFLENSDFIEGIRAQIIDKDKQPHWLPPTIAEVNQAIVARFFN